MSYKPTARDAQSLDDAKSKKFSRIKNNTLSEYMEQQHTCQHEAEKCEHELENTG
jgi:hypothetical protein